MDDLISRQAAIDDIKAMYEWHDVVTEDRLIEHMKRLPSAQPDSIPAEEPKVKGKWIGGELGECSICGHEGCASDIWTGCEKTYCPNCGNELEGI